jgi:serine/threonine protein kinase
VHLDPSLTEEIHVFSINDYRGQALGANQQKYCISIERPSLTLDRVVDGMLRNDGYRQDPDLRRRYAGKVCTVLRMVAKSLRHIHSLGLIHGDLSMENCGKFDEAWKVMGCIGLQRIGQKVDLSRWKRSFPPESVMIGEDEQGGIYDADNVPVTFTRDFVANPSADVWAFGKLAFEMLVGRSLVDHDPSKNPRSDRVAMLQVMEWDEDNLKTVFESLLDASIPDSGADLFASCLFPTPAERPKSMDEILASPFWKDMRKAKGKGSSRSDRPKRSEASSSNQSSETYEI